MNIIRKQRQGSKGGPTPPVEIIFFNNLIQSDEPFKPLMSRFIIVLISDQEKGPMSLNWSTSRLFTLKFNSYKRKNFKHKF